MMATAISRPAPERSTSIGMPSASCMVLAFSTEAGGNGAGWPIRPPTSA